MATLSEVQARLEQDGIEFILVQFCDIHGAAKAKMVPAQELGEMVTGGAGFAGAAVWGMGQGPHSHDMLARVDLETYTPLSWMPNTARFAANLFVDGEPHPLLSEDESDSRTRRGSVPGLRVHDRDGARALPDRSRRRRDAAGLGSGVRRYARQAVLRLPLDGARDGVPAGADELAQCPGLGRLSDRSRGWERPVRGELQLRRCADDGGSDHVLQDGRLADCQEVRRDRHLHAQAVRESNGQRFARPLQPGRRGEPRERLRRPVGPSRPRALRAGLSLPRRRAASTLPHWSR